MQTLKFTLPESNNSEYYNLLNRSNSLIVRRNDINKSLLFINTKMWYSCRAKKILAAIRPDVESFTTDALKWKNEATNFILKPHFIFPDGDHLQLEFQHFIDNLRDSAHRIETSINLLENNFNNIGVFIDSQLNFRLAFSSFIIALVALIVALIPMFLP